MRKLSAAFAPLKFLVRVLLAAALLIPLGCARKSGLDEHFPSETAGSGIFSALPLPLLDYEPFALGTSVPSRIVSLVPSATETVWALGLGDRLVGRSHWCDFPPSVSILPDLGRFESIAKEAIADLKPDVVLAFETQAGLAKSLREDLGLKVYCPPTEKTDAIFEGMEGIARALGVPERGRRLRAWLEADLEAVAREFKEATPKKVLVVLDRNPLYVPGRASFVAWLLERVSAENVAASLSEVRDWPTVSLEAVLDWNPEVIIDLSMGADRAAAISEGSTYWREQPGIRAVSGGRVHFVDAGVLVRPGPRLSAAARELGRLIHQK